METGKKVKIIRQALKLTQTEFAEPLGVGKGQVSGVERGNKEFSNSVLLLLMSHYKVDPVWWETGSGPIFLEDDLRERVERDRQEILEEIKSLYPDLYPIARDMVLLPTDQLPKLGKIVRAMVKKSVK